MLFAAIYNICKLLKMIMLGGIRKTATNGRWVKPIVQAMDI